MSQDKSDDGAGHFPRIGNPFARWQRLWTPKLLRVEHIHESHHAHTIFRQGVRNLIIWFNFIELHDSRTGQHIFRVKGPDRTDVIQITDERGRLERTIVFGEDDYRAYLDLLTISGG